MNRFSILLIGLMTLVPLFTHAAELPLYSVGGKKIISGEGDAHVVAAVAHVADVSGDAIIFAKDILLTGALGGDLHSLSNRLEISGEILDDVRVASRHISITGNIGGHLIAVGESIDMGSGAQIRDTAALIGRTIVADGRFDQSVTFVGDSVTLSGEFEEDVTVLARQSLTLSPDAIFHGKLEYAVQPGATVSVGEHIGDNIISGRLLASEGWSQFFLKMPLPRIRWSFFSSLWLLGACFILCFPHAMRRLQTTIRTLPLQSAGCGLLLMFSGLFLFLILLLPFFFLNVLLLSFLFCILCASLSITPLVVIREKSCQKRMSLLLYYSIASIGFFIAWTFLPWITIIFSSVFMLIILGAVPYSFLYGDYSQSYG